MSTRKPSNIDIFFQLCTGTIVACLSPVNPDDIPHHRGCWQPAPGRTEEVAWHGIVGLGASLVQQAHRGGRVSAPGLVAVAEGAHDAVDVNLCFRCPEAGQVCVRILPCT